MEQEIKKKKKKSRDEYLLDFSSGVVVGYIGQYVGNVIVNALHNRENIFEDRLVLSDYLAGMVTAAVGAALADNLNLVQLVVLSTSIYYTVLNSINELTGLDEVQYGDEFFEDYITDVILVYLIVWFRDLFVDEWRRIRGIKKKEANTFTEKLADEFSSGFIITVYYAIREYQRELNEENNSNNNSNNSKNNGNCINDNKIDQKMNNN